jgi:aminopeptidase N
VRNSLWLVLPALLVAAACGSTPGEKPPMTETPPPDRDIHSHARPWEARVTHVALDLTADFAAKTLAGSATLDVERASGAKEVVLDTKGLAV